MLVEIKYEYDTKGKHLTMHNAMDGTSRTLLVPETFTGKLLAEVDDDIKTYDELIPALTEYLRTMSPDITSVRCKKASIRSIANLRSRKGE